MTMKLTLLFSQSSAASKPLAPSHRIGGWSESWYSPDTTTTAAIARATGQNQPLGFSMLGLLPARASLLGLGASIVGLRIQSVVPPGPSQSVAVNYPGQQANNTDIPQMALLCKAPGSGVINVRRFTLRGVPDNQVFEGEATFDPNYQAALNTFFASLNGYQFRGRDLAQPINKIVSISAAGVVTFEVGVTYNPLDFLRVLKAKDSSGNLRGGRFQIASVGPGPNIVNINGWTFGSCTGGTGRKDAIVFPVVDFANTAFSRVVTRRVGRPSNQYRGRRSRRR